MGVTEPAAVELLTAVSRLVRTARTYSHLRNQQFGPSGVTVGVLKRLSVASARPGDLAVQLCVTPSAVSRAVATLEDHGYVARQADPTDARACFLALTAAGADELARLHHEQARNIAGLLEGWDDAKAAQLSELLTELDDALAGSILPLRNMTTPTTSEKAFP